MRQREDKLVQIDQLPRGIFAVVGRDNDCAVIQLVGDEPRQFGIPLTILNRAGVIANGIVPSRLELSQGGIWGVGEPYKPINEGHCLFPPPGPRGEQLQLSDDDIAALNAAS